MNGVIYARYSSDNQREESIEGQLRECKEYAVRNEITIIGTYIDRAFSAKTDNRPQFQQMIHDSNARLFDTVLVWKLDRFSRNRYDSAYYKRILKNNKVQIISVTEPISSTPEGIMLESLLEGMAEYYSAELAEKVSRGLKENALKAKFNGGPVPLGYRINENQHYQIDPTMAPVVREAFRRYADGEGMKALCEELNRRGIRTGRGKPFTKCSFQNMLKNRRYLGEYRYKDIIVEGAIPAIIDPATFARVQKRSKQNKIISARTRTTDPFILTSKVFCGKCGAVVAGDSGTSHTGVTHYYYKCGNRKRRSHLYCDLKAVHKEWLEQMVTHVAIHYILQENEMNTVAEMAVAYRAEENPRLPTLRTQLRDVNKRIKNLISAIEEGIVSTTTCQRLDDLEQQRANLEASIRQEEMKHPKMDKEQIIRWMQRFKDLDLDDLRIQRQIIDCFVNTVYLFDDNLIVNFNFSQESRRVTLHEVQDVFKENAEAQEDDARPNLVFYGDGFGVVFLKDSV